MMHKDPLERLPLSTGLIYCSILSASFVASLYFFVPSHIRSLERDNHLQIKWRTAATTIVCVVSTSALSWWIPAKETSSLTWRQSARAILAVISHTAMLYLGPVTQMVVQVAIATQKKQQELQQRFPESPSCSFSSLFCKIWHSSFIAPLIHSIFVTTSSNERCICLRNRVIAPITEELLFRRCIVPILWSTGMDTARIVVVAPIFFGSAHLHHAISRWRQASAQTILLQTLVQFTYTSVFGAYSAYIYLRTGSVVAIVLSHAFCNGMGLPDLAFTRPFSSLYTHRYLLGLAHLGGIVFFQRGFQSKWLLPDNRFTSRISQ